MKPLLLDYASLATFDDMLRGPMVDLKHLHEDGLVEIKTLTTADGGEMEFFRGWKFEKGSERYLLEQYDDQGNRLQLKDLLPLVPEKTRQVGVQGKIYDLIVEYKVVKFKPENVLGMKKLIDHLNIIPHTNPTHRKLFLMMGLTQWFSRSYFRVATPPGFGKDSFNDTLKHLVGNCGTLTNPTVARLEQETTTTDWLAITEVTKIPNSKWDEDELFLLDCAAHKPSTNKRSKAHGKVGDQLSLNNFSISLFYNDVTNSRTTDKYIDFFADDQLLDRFPAFRFYGHFEYTFDKASSKDLKKLVSDNKQDYMDIIYTLTYFKEHFDKMEPRFTSNVFNDVSNRQLIGLNKFLKTVSLYATDRKEFDTLVKALRDAMLDYRAMIAYPALFETVTKDMPQYTKAYKDLKSNLQDKKTFSEKIKLLDQKLRGEETETTKEVKEHDWW